MKELHLLEKLLQSTEIFKNGSFFTFLLHVSSGPSDAEGRRKKHETILTEISIYIILEAILGNNMLFPNTKS